MFHSNSPYLTDLIVDNQWEQIPQEFITREGRKASFDEVAGKLYLPIESRHGVINLRQISNPILLWVVIKYLVHLARVVSSITAMNGWNDIVRVLKAREFLSKSASCVCPEIMQEALISQVVWAIAHYAQEGKLWCIYRFVQWYIWSAECYPELGFSIGYAFELEEMAIPGNPKGVAVRDGLLDGGALHPELEIPLVQRALENDNGGDFRHYQQRAAVSLASSYGRNPANYAALLESDLYDVLRTPEAPLWNLNIPRIKKGFVSHRSDFISESLELSTLHHLQALIEQNARFESLVEVNGVDVEVARPMFRRLAPNGIFLRIGMYDHAFCMYGNEITKLLQEFVVRVKLISPLTGELLHLTSRRFRYSIGTMYAAMGMSREEVAARLDHSDVQNVQVYFDLLDTMRNSLDKAAALHYAEHVNAFLGAAPIEANLIATDRRINYPFEDTGEVEQTGGCGLESQCHRYPPLSCYLCPKFIPFKSKIHQRVLEQLLLKQDAMRSPHGLGVALTDVILAVAQVVLLCGGFSDGAVVAS
ncbi:hypothetical protein N5D83_21045 [Pseudomonas chengduensis]|nr:hypothetical protein [Pseudomonas chengduensis]MDH1869272.1 hypothetical protein [Pseudomonas chengduensis]